MVGKAIIKDSVIYGGADFFSKILAFIAFPIIAAALHPRSFGALELILTSVALVGVVVNCGLNNAVQRFYWDKDVPESSQPSIVTTGLLLQMAFCFSVIIVGFALLYVFLSALEESDLPFTAIALGSALFLLATTRCTQFILDVTRLHFAPWRFFALALLGRVLTLAVGVVAVVYMGLGIDGMLSGQVLVFVVILPLALWMIRRDLALSDFNLNWAGELVKFGSPFIFMGLAYWLFNSMDRWMLSSMRSLEEVGVYSIAARFASVVLFLSAAFGQAFSPLAMKIRRDYPDEYRFIFGQILIGLLAIMLLAGFAVSVFAGEILFVLMPLEYMGAAIPMILLCFAVVIQSAQQVVAIGISIEKKTHLFAKLAWVAAVINLLGNWLLIPTYGASGAAISTVLSHAFLSASYFFFTQKLHAIVVPTYLFGLLAMLFGVFLAASIAFVQSTFMVDVVLWKLTLLVICCVGIGASAHRYLSGLWKLDHAQM